MRAGEETGWYYNNFTLSFTLASLNPGYIKGVITGTGRSIGRYATGSDENGDRFKITMKNVNNGVDFSFDVIDGPRYIQPHHGLGDMTAEFNITEFPRGGYPVVAYFEAIKAVVVRQTGKAND